MVNGSALASNQLAISVPSSMMVKDTISISVTSGTGTPADNAEVSFDGTVIGDTNSTGKLDYILTKAGQHNITATKLGFVAATKTVQIAEYVDNRLNFEMPDIIDQYIPVKIKVKVSGTGNYSSGVNITLDGTGIGSTDSSGTLAYSFTASGKHNLVASKTGYISVQRDIDIRLPFTEFKALDIGFRPDVVNKGQNVIIWSNITNTGTKEGTLPVALIINNTVVENSNVTLAPGKQGMVNFTHKIELVPGNYTVEILGQKTTMPVKEEPLNLFILVGAVTGIGIIAVIFVTSKNLMNMETVNKVVSKTKSNLGSLTSKFTKKGGSLPPRK
ncbi:Carboxypeptidase regulatory-like domain protein [uncultured archaeon]|nr:Carboxypeptidase regulatory-like domain protein [uncultured archaeon]